MCGRFSLDTLPDTLARHFDLREAPALQPRGNIAPSQDIAVIRLPGQDRECVLLRWGLVPAWSKEPKTRYSTINARAETVAEKPAYRNAFRRRRCLIPATGFYEWQQAGNRKIPHHIRRKDRGLFAFAGLWERWEQGADALESCTIIVTTANRLLAPIHARMPVILEPDRYREWLDPQSIDTAALRSLLVPCAADSLEAYPVSQPGN
ncbi:MAG: SOS response-associated peptidase [Gammaproteobacteria bacterium]|jgi:putative SOS response-associated peptidase YedK